MSARLIDHHGGWKRGAADPTRLAADTTGLAILPEVDPRAALPPVFDQLALGSCTANATAAAFQYDAILDGADPGLLSRLWIYWQERKLEGSLGEGDCGAEGSDAFKVASTIGIPPETDWPYDIADFNPAAPPAAATAGDGAYKLAKPYVTPPLTQAGFQQVLSNKQTIAFGFTVYPSFESAAVAGSGIVPMPGASEQSIGGHETLIIGYLEAYPAYALVRNSWGSEQTDGVQWGIDGDGYFLMPWSYLLNANLAGDWTTIVRAAA